MGLLLQLRILTVALAVCGIASPQDQEGQADRGVGGSIARNTFNKFPDESSLDPLPTELKSESAIYVQRRLGEWQLADAREVLGEPRGRRDAFQEGAVTGDIYAFRDPSNRYREFELLFDRQTKTLRSAFIYPWRMTWDECLDLWGDEVNSTAMPNGNVFRSYLHRHLDILTDKSGAVISLGIY